ncbi:hypothetical protein J7J00_14140 [Bacillus sp. ISL-4]|uniref:hypothetical protein n=1 Tax=Bacillus sp. ISL-4 TaxID=2819125 RepID=UPI001BE99AC4|nr:hypothetical protein [Bacillus sp. ISL-4]MBT2666646.1 hypothetical protein [Bacillus sp. ISL-4]MBT2670796.1 hypothetical protein [Streptomyces sp. ISL-14]
MEEKVGKYRMIWRQPAAFLPECQSKALILLVMKAICLLGKSLEPNIYAVFCVHFLINGNAK